MKLSIVIPSRNMGDKVEQCLSSVFCTNASRDDFEVVVCDSSTDNSMDVFRAWAEREKNLRIIHGSRKLAPGPARNLAVEKCSGDYLMFLDIDDRIHDDKALERILGALGDKDVYACSYLSVKDNHVFVLKPESFFQLAQCPVAPWGKIYRRSLYVPFPSYTPEDVAPHYVLLDRCQTFGYFDFAVIDYDNRPENKGAWSRTFDWLVHHPSNMLALASENTLERLGLNDDYISGVLHNLGDMWRLRNRLRNPDVKRAFVARFTKEWQNLMSGIYVH